MLKYVDETGRIKENTDKTIDDLKQLEITGTTGTVMELDELASIVICIWPGKHPQGEPGKENYRNI